MGKSQRLDGWKAITAYLRLPMRTTRQLASKLVPDAKRLPVHRWPMPGTNRVFAYVEQLDAWEASMGTPHATNDRAGRPPKRGKALLTPSHAKPRKATP